VDFATRSGFRSRKWVSYSEVSFVQNIAFLTQKGVSYSEVCFEVRFIIRIRFLLQKMGGNCVPPSVIITVKHNLCYRKKFTQASIWCFR